ncbi:MAG TPA: hybrid sensor histidine kinase/response regulator [Polyangiaceae bacterium]|nr:hybrid sensor histidine kinase/response regulator [Polyangiaceae bacterium]
MIRSAPAVKILLVDDVPENLLVLEALLQREGVELLLAYNGREALELLLQHDVARALLDVHMPTMDGFELAELMRGTERTRHVPIIFVTAGPREAQRVFRGYELGAVDFLFKPIDPILLGHKVTTFVELHRQRDELREMLRLNEMFVAVIGHDLRTPLSTIVTGAAFLDRERLEPNARRTLERIRSSGQRMVAMIDQLNDLARARLGGGISLERTKTNLRAIVDTVVDEQRIASPDRRIDVHHEQPDAVEGEWDEHRLAQVVANLVGNAIRHGKASAPVVVTTSGTDATAKLVIHNAGHIAEEALAHVFDPFWHGSTTKRESLGLGLFIVDQIVRSHDGTIAVESTEPSGTTFCVELPKR